MINDNIINHALRRRNTNMVAINGGQCPPYAMFFLFFYLNKFQEFIKWSCDCCGCANKFI